MRVLKNLGASAFMATVIVLVWAGLNWLFGYTNAYYELFMGAVTGAFAVFFSWDLENEQQGK